MVSEFMGWGRAAATFSRPWLEQRRELGRLGSGEWHDPRIVLPFPVDGPVRMEFDVDAQLIGRRTDQSVEAWVEGVRLATWEFTLDQKRGERDIVVPEDLVRKSLAVRWHFIDDRVQVGPLGVAK